MTVSKSIEPYDFLINDSWECEDLIDALNKEGNWAKEAFNSYVENTFAGESPDVLELNDFLRFESQDILKGIGIDEDEDD